MFSMPNKLAMSISISCPGRFQRARERKGAREAGICCSSSRAGQRELWTCRANTHLRTPLPGWHFSHYGQVLGGGTVVFSK